MPNPNPKEGIEALREHWRVHRRNTLSVAVRLPAELVAALDKLEGTRTSHVEQAIREYLERGEQKR